MSKIVSDIPGLINELGGLTAASQFFGEQPQTVGNWRIRKQLPTQKFFQHDEALRKAGIKAPRELWGFSTSPDQSKERVA